MIYTNEIIKKKYEKKLIIKRLLKIVYVPIIAGIILITILAGYKKYVKHENNISILGFRQYVVATGSMEPEYNIGDLIVIRETTKEEIKIGDVINYISDFYFFFWFFSYNYYISNIVFRFHTSWCRSRISKL